MRWNPRRRVRWQRAALFVGVVMLAIVARSLLSAAQTHTTVGSYFDSPPDWPGHAWTRNGVAVSSSELEAAAGPAHCGWQSVTLLTIGWPPGTMAASANEARQYVRDPAGAMPANYLQGAWARNPVLPLDAGDTGFRYGTLKLLLAPSDRDRYVYLVAPADSERWPRSDPMTICQ